MSTKTLSITLFLFTALTLTHAALVNYRSGAAEVQPQFRAEHAKMLVGNEMAFLQTRKFAALDLALENYGNGGRRTIWRGGTRSTWTDNGLCLCCGAFELLAKMKGGKTRTRILKALPEPKNKLQLARELGADWKAVDNHMKKLLFYGLVAEIAVVGTCRLYAITQKGTRALELMGQTQDLDSRT